MSRGQEALFQRLADDLSEDIVFEMMDCGISPNDLVDAVLPRGEPGASFHRKRLKQQFEALIEHDAALDLVTALQVCEAMGWLIGLVEDDVDSEG